MMAMQSGSRSYRWIKSLAARRRGSRGWPAALRGRPAAVMIGGGGDRRGDGEGLKHGEVGKNVGGIRG
jgi:hypothetical protein